MSRNARTKGIRRRRLALDPHCAFCGRRLSVDDSSLDHVVPRVGGGRTQNWNLWLACVPCNTGKGPAPVDKIVCLLPRGSGIGILRHPRELRKRIMAVKTFNYRAVKDETTRRRVKQQAKDIRELLQRDAACIVEIGQRLIEVRDVLGPAFRKWVDAEFEFAPSVASNYIRVAERFGDLDCLNKFQPFALYQLCRQAVPQSAIEAAVSRARAGEFITGTKAREILVEHGHKPKQYRTTRAPASRTEPEPERNGSLEALTASLDAFSANLEQSAAGIPKRERERLADRFLQLALQLRSVATGKGRAA